MPRRISRRSSAVSDRAIASRAKNPSHASRSSRRACFSLTSAATPGEGSGRSRASSRCNSFSRAAVNCWRVRSRDSLWLAEPAPLGVRTERSAARTGSSANGNRSTTNAQRRSARAGETATEDRATREWYRSPVSESHFKEWAKPGPVPPGALSPPIVPVDETLDAISGHFRIFQLRRGHRFSTDDVLTAWYGTTWAPSAATVLDLGSGIGSVGMIAAWRLPGARFVTVEAQDDSVRLARKSAAYNGLGDRYEIRHGDFRTEGVLHRDERFDLILGSPPYFPPGSGLEGDHPQKIACRFEMRGDIGDYCAAAARHLGSGGVF